MGRHRRVTGARARCASSDLCESERRKDRVLVACSMAGLLIVVALALTLAVLA